MKKILALLATMTLSVALCAALCACGGEGTSNSKNNSDNNASSNSSDSSSSTNSASQTTTNADQTTSVQPAFDISGDWKASMDDHELGTITFKMQPNGNFTGNLNVAAASAATLEGSMSGYNAEWTMRYQSLGYLGSVTFDESKNRGTGQLVDGKGTAHELILTR